MPGMGRTRVNYVNLLRGWVMRQLAIIKYRVVPSSDGKFIVLQCEAREGQRFDFGFVPEVARGVGVDLIEAARSPQIKN